MNSKSNQESIPHQDQNINLIQKQQYLRTNIDPDDYINFGQYCLQKKGNQEIQKWTLTQVKQLVDLFRIWKQFFVVPLDQNNQINTNAKQQNIHLPTTQTLKGQKQDIQNDVIEIKPVVIQVSPNKNDQSFSALDLLDLLDIESTQNTNKQKGQSTKEKNHTNQSNLKQQIDLLSDSIKQTKQVPLTKIIKISPVQQIKQKNGRSSDISIGQKNPQSKNLSSSQTFFNKSSVLINVPKVYKQQFQQVIQCKKLQPLNYDSIKRVQVKKHQIVHKAFFLPDYVMYHIELQPLNIVCKRNYQDFTRLNQILKKMYPGVKLPYLQSNSWLSETNIQFIKKQKVCLQYYLNELIRHDTLRNCLTLYQFLTVSDHKTIKRKFQKYQENPIPKSIDKLQNNEGKQYLRLSNADNYFIQKGANFSRQITSFLSHFNQLGVSLIANYESISSTFNQMKKSIQSLKKKAKQFLELQQKLGLPFQDQIKELPNALKMMQQICKIQYSSINSKRQLLFQKLFPFTKYQQTNISSIQQILYHRQTLQNHMINQIQSQPTSPSTSLKIKHEGFSKNVYLSSQLKQHKNGILQLSYNGLVAKYHLAFLNNRVKKEIIQMFQYFGRGLRETIGQRIESFLNKQKNAEFEQYVKLLQKTKKQNIFSLSQSLVRTISSP